MGGVTSFRLDVVAAGYACQRASSLVHHHDSRTSSQLSIHSVESSITMTKSVVEPHPAHSEGAPLLRHLSMDEYVSHEEAKKKARQRSYLRKYGPPLILSILAVLLVALTQYKRVVVVPIERANQHYLDIGGDMSLWYRTWGNRKTGVPVLFVHGGPGNCIADYGLSNGEFFDAYKYFVIEVDQRGTGKSQPSVRDDCANMAYYKDISIEKMSRDFELLRKSLGLDKWLIFGGSWGSTLSLDYAERYPERCLGLILRGIYLNTRAEFDAVFSRRPYLDNPKRLAEFDTWFQLAAQDAIEAGEETLDPNDSERFFRIYERMIQRCNRNAIWRYHVFENNLMETEPENLLDPMVIDEEVFPEAQSIGFFETRLFLHGTFEKPARLIESVPNLLNGKKRSSRPLRVWICQGHRDEVCPEKYAHLLVDALDEAGVRNSAYFVDSGHEATDPVMHKCLEERLHDFYIHQTSSSA